MVLLAVDNGGLTVDSETIELVARIPSIYGNIHLPERSSVTGVVPEGLRFTGVVKCPTKFQIDGSFVGSLDCPYDRLHVGPGANFNGTAIALHATIEGEFLGSLNCPRGVVNFTNTAFFDATIRYGELEVAEGATVCATMYKVHKHDVDDVDSQTPPRYAPPVVDNESTPPF